MGSTRLPGKVLMETNGIPLLVYEFRRVQLSREIDKIVVATTTDPSDDRIEGLCVTMGIDYFRGSPQDVLDRYEKCAEQYPDADTIVRVTGDCPLIDPSVIDLVIQTHCASGADYTSNVEVGRETYPDGMDVEVFRRTALITAAREARLPSEREHVTPFIRNNIHFLKSYVAAEKDHSSVRLTVDNPEDLEVVRFVIEHSAPTDGYLSYVRLLDTHPVVRSKNMLIVRNEGYEKSLAEDPNKPRP